MIAATLMTPTIVSRVWARNVNGVGERDGHQPLRGAGA